VKPARESIFFFGSVAKYGGGAEYGAALRSVTREQRFEQLADQVWELSRIASGKYTHTKRAYRIAVAFLASWAIARLSLSLAM
jgi:Family of unknown function (DUF5706)